MASWYQVKGSANKQTTPDPPGGGLVIPGELSLLEGNSNSMLTGFGQLCADAAGEPIRSAAAWLTRPREAGEANLLDEVALGHCLRDHQL